MFGFELQTQNVFVSRSGVADIGEREVVYHHPVGLTLEGDETHLLGATSELEFVTKPFADERSARAALTVAARIAAKLAEGGQRDITFDQNTEPSTRTPSSRAAPGCAAAPCASPTRPSALRPRPPSAFHSRNCRRSSRPF
ncbi:hypothetical protein [Candidatus Frankia nodulisporulans]|uniref:hypothetical protein n=1 Tax=Candidatus Frankia nodulisporulans TaxID=2060052 RepID=UPI0013D5D950|nr:hypothetical protein [Candidatus Frankia nodulisporulans]